MTAVPEHQHIVDFMPPAVRYGGDVLAAGGITMTFIGWLPSIAALLGIIWYLILIVDRVQKWREARAKKKAGE